MAGESCDSNRSSSLLDHFLHPSLTVFCLQTDFIDHIADEVLDDLLLISLPNRTSAGILLLVETIPPRTIEFALHSSTTIVSDRRIVAERTVVDLAVELTGFGGLLDVGRWREERE